MGYKIPTSLTTGLVFDGNMMTKRILIPKNILWDSCQTKLYGSICITTIPNNPLDYSGTSLKLEFNGQRWTRVCGGGCVCVRGCGVTPCNMFILAVENKDYIATKCDISFMALGLRI